MEDSGEIYGLERDLGMLENSTDRLTQMLSSLVADRIGPEFSRLVQIHFEDLSEKQVCVVDVDRSMEPAFMTSQKGREFYVRLGNTSRALDPEQTMNFIEFSAV